MRDRECVELLRWALPRLGFRWAGFRRMRRQVCKRVDRRRRALGLPDTAAYRARLAADPVEWRALDGLCRVTVSRFWRDAPVFEHLCECVLPELACLARARRENGLRVWSAGCGSGEEPYSVRLAWDLALAGHYPGMRLTIVGTDTDPVLLRRARRACYQAGALWELPEGWAAQGFERVGENLCLRSRYRHEVCFLRQDVREAAPPGRFHLVLCRNLAFTYFAEPVQRRVLRRLLERMHEDAVLVIGRAERLPAGEERVVPLGAELGVYRRPAPRRGAQGVRTDPGGERANGH